MSICQKLTMLLLLNLPFSLWAMEKHFPDQQEKTLTYTIFEPQYNEKYQFHIQLTIPTIVKTSPHQHTCPLLNSALYPVLRQNEQTPILYKSLLFHIQIQCPVVNQKPSKIEERFDKNYIKKAEPKANINNFTPIGGNSYSQEELDKCIMQLEKKTTKKEDAIKMAAWAYYAPNLEKDLEEKITKIMNLSNENYSVKKEDIAKYMEKPSQSSGDNQKNTDLSIDSPPEYSKINLTIRYRQVNFTKTWREEGMWAINSYNKLCSNSDVKKVEGDIERLFEYMKQLKENLTQEDLDYIEKNAAPI